MIKLLEQSPEGLVAALAALGVSCQLREARQVLSRVVAEGSDDPTPRREPRRALVEALRVNATWARPVVERRVEDPDDGSVRYLFRGRDGAKFEAVRIPLEKPGCFTVCLSSQAGCAMACTFCYTGRLGLTRNLEAHEIVGQLLTARDEAPGRVTGVVFMGQGEPFHNYDAVLRAAGVFCHPAGGRIAAEAITISTVGLVPQIRRFTRERQPYKLIVSLTSAVEERRARLLPVAGRTPLAELADALREHVSAVGGRVTVAWVLLGGVNDGLDEVAALEALLDGIPVRVNLIDVNDLRPEGFRRSSPEELREFLDGLQVLKMPVIRRYSVGRERHSACGMLAGAE